MEDVSKLIHIRKDHSSLRYGDFLTLQADESIYAYLRSDMNERILTIINKNSTAKTFKSALPEVYKLKMAEDLLTGDTIEIINDQIELNVRKMGYLILKLN
jgi:glycosidase